MKKSELKQIIKEEIVYYLNESNQKIYELVRFIDNKIIKLRTEF